MRTTGEIASTREMASGDHTCWTFSNDAERSSTLNAYFLEGLDRGERIAFFAPETLRSVLPSVIGDHETRALIEAGRFVFVPMEYFFDANGSFDYESVLRVVERLAATPSSEGYTALRVAAEAGWLLDRLGPTEELLRFEFRSELLTASAPLTALCSYDMRDVDHNALGLMQALHPARLGPAGNDPGFTLTSGGEGTAAIAGEIDCAFADHIGSLLEDGADLIRTLDVSGLGFVDIAGIRALSGAVERIRWAHGSVRIVGATNPLQRLWRILGLNERIDVSFQ